MLLHVRIVDVAAMVLHERGEMMVKSLIKLSDKYFGTHDYRIWHEPFGQWESETFCECKRGCGARISSLGPNDKVMSTPAARKPCPKQGFAK